MSNTKPLSILVLDPRKQAGESLKETLADHSFYVESVSDTQAVLDKLNDRTWSILLLDDHGPDFDIYEFLLEVRRLHPIGLELLILSDNKLRLQELHELGAWGVLRKPFNVTEFLLVAKRLVPATQDIRRLQEPSFSELCAIFTDISRRSFDLRARVHDLGRGGFSLFVPKEQRVPEVGQIVNFDIQLSMLPRTHVRGRGIVRWIYNESEQLGVGIEFLQVTEADERLVTAFADLFKIRAFVPLASEAA